MVLEIISIEKINGCYSAKVKDLAGEEIEAMFHADCSDFFAKDVKRNSVLVLDNVATFSLNKAKFYLVIMAECINRIVK